MSTEKPTQPSESPGRTLVLCFDGTGCAPVTDAHACARKTNIVKLFMMLDKSKKDEQLVYYQPGIGTYSGCGVLPDFKHFFAQMSDMAIGWYFDMHVKEGYRFLMKNYCEGDRICLFGFSRGAYTARVLAGMLCKVGLLPKDNDEQVNFAFKIFNCKGESDNKKALDFKTTFSRDVLIDFVGCWDTVASVGILWARHFPFTSNNTSIKCFRHALSLDEYGPEQGSYMPKTEDSNGDVDHKEESETDVLEVWFPGCHSDVGGGPLSNDGNSLSNISLRWMVRMIIRSGCRILFCPNELRQYGIPESLDELDKETRLVEKAAEAYAGDSATSGSQAHGDGCSCSLLDDKDKVDALEDPYDALKHKPIWWSRELVPIFVHRQDEKGKWHSALRSNFGRGRKLLISSPYLHGSVQHRKEKLGYVPKAVWNDKPKVKCLPAKYS